MTKDITPEEIKAAVKARDMERWDLRECSICGTAIGYLFLSKNLPFFDTNCECSTMESIPRKSSYQEIAEVVNMQNGEAKEKLLKFWRE